MQITTASGTMNLDDNVRPSLDDQNDIVTAVVCRHAPVDRSSDDEEQQSQRGAQELLFIALGNASCRFAAGLTNAEFLAACEAWLEANG